MHHVNCYHHVRQQSMPLPRRISSLALLLALCLAGCGGGGSGGDTGSSSNALAPASCTTADQRIWLKSYMEDQYFWFDHLGTANEAAKDMNGYFSSLLYPVVDRYSFTESTTQFVQFYREGTFVGYGYSLAWSDAARTILKVRTVEPLSPVGLAGLKRGDTIISIDGYTPAQIVAGTPGRVSSAGISRTLVVGDATGATRTLNVNSAEFAYVSVPAASVLTQDIGGSSIKVGYMVYQQFINASVGELATAFTSFAAAGVKQLIVDLRYNGGGSVAVARDLASMLGGSSLAGKVFINLRYNTRHPENNSTYGFAYSAQLPAAPLNGLSRVIFITAEGTASASELVINGLKPYIPVVIVGTTTYGKPYGFMPVDACGLTYNTVNFESVNALGEGRYDNGIAPTCEVADDLDHQLGDPAEKRLSAALQYIKTGSCAVPSARTSVLKALASSTQRGGADNAFGEVPPQRMVAD